MDELGEPMWAVISAEGCEARSLTYTQAAELVRRLTREKKYGLCIITNEAAGRAAPSANDQPAPHQPKVARRRKGRRRKD